ncbi:MAG: type II 3-dehydroquinate dehydratase [Endomicrobium sp.]|jgi:3-dehydroquinate dehydratase-2|uniref:type II 3-dehydroquinate dehydratase n=1 Tax=Candidatus Endomicrobiellum cubanum TaxID=3242325 RepID=UPI0028378E7E|nr:type II 3-dehydroquinate dehydratase [Endomicrobium sp.]
MKKVLVLNGPNINILGVREPTIYGNATISNIEQQLKALAKELNLEIELFQSNHEGKIIDKIQNSLNDTSGIIINPAAFTHTSIAIRDALSCLEVPIIEVHISNIYIREEFRHKSYIAPITAGQIIGFGIDGYLFALKKIKSLI